MNFLVIQEGKNYKKIFLGLIRYYSILFFFENIIRKAKFRDQY